jgi:hypothetical protein
MSPHRQNRFLTRPTDSSRRALFIGETAKIYSHTYPNGRAGAISGASNLPLPGVAQSCPCLTDRAIRNAEPENKALRIFDGDGMYMEIAPSGRKWWRLRYRVCGKQWRMSLGIYPDVSLADARDRRDAARFCDEVPGDTEEIAARELETLLDAWRARCD